MLMPRFMAQESWDNSGNIEIWFIDNMTQDLKDKVNSELTSIIDSTPNDEKSIYHIEILIKSIFKRMYENGNLRISEKHKRWVWVEEV